LITIYLQTLTTGTLIKCAWKDPTLAKSRHHTCFYLDTRNNWRY